ncbi:hypothetical protein BGZ95_001879 [Linnemannia exigua]|uniref:Uncharacterized protein n=1 Tax=Linnemannia exigua TaxID=604196 RepID=A0AAD4H3F2_9FUNG|nr:hypothetical protein BGZ95_001879 [Linnemannia exigua]
MFKSLPPTESKPPHNRRSSRRRNTASTATTVRSMKGLLTTAFLATLALLPRAADAQLQCQQFGADTFRVGSTLKFGWSDASGGSGAESGIPSFNIDLYCYESSKYMQTVATVDTTNATQYQGRLTWNTTDPNTGLATTGSALCKTILLVGLPTPSGGGAQQPNPQSPNTSEDDPPTGDIEITDKTKNIIIGVGCAVGALVLAGLVGFYYIRFKNKRAVEKSANRKLREPLQPDLSRPGTGPGTSASHARYNELGSGTTSIVGYSPLQRPGEMVELKGMPSSSSRPQSEYRSASPTPIASRHAANNSGLLAQPSTSFSSDRPPSLLTSPFTPPGEEPNPFQSRPSGRAPPPPATARAHDHDDEERQLYEQQFQQQQQQQQQQIQQQQMHQQQLQQNYGGYQY